MSRVLVLKRGITHDLHASDIIWYHLVKGSVWSMSIVCRMSCFACIARISFWASLHAVRDCLHWHAPWCWTVFSSSWHTLKDTGNQPLHPACPIVIDIIVLSPWIPVYFLAVSQLRYIFRLPSAVKAGTCQRKPLPCFLGNLASKPRSHYLTLLKVLRKKSVSIFYSSGYMNRTASENTVAVRV